MERKLFVIIIYFLSKRFSLYIIKVKTFLKKKKKKKVSENIKFKKYLSSITRENDLMTNCQSRL
jgi:hypothetical protein